MREHIRLDRIQYNEDRLSEVLENRILTSTGCLIHSGRKDTYGTLYYKGKQHNLHRLSYIREHGEIPKGMHILHTCNNKNCSNVEHLYLGTQKENVRDSKAGNNKNRIEREERELERQEKILFQEFTRP